MPPDVMPPYVRF